MIKVIVLGKIKEQYLKDLIDDYKKSVMLEEESVPTYQITLIVSGSIIILITIFIILFHKKKAR